MSGRSPEDLERALTAAERRLAELQAWADASDAEAVTLRAKVLKLEAASSDGKVAELTQWLDNAYAMGLGAKSYNLVSLLPAGSATDGGAAANTAID